MSEIIISNPKSFEKKKNAIISKGANELHILSDFDRTITYAFIDGEKVSTSFASIRDNNYLGEEYINKAKEYFEKFHPIEVSEDFSFEEKDKVLDDWWKKHFEILIEYGITKRIFLEIVEKGRVILRKGVKKFFEFCKDKNIPIVIISSGLGDFIPEMLMKEGILFENVYVYSNMFKFDSQGNAVGMGKEIIHTINKRIKNIEEIGFYLEIKDRKNLILLGDDLTDLKMSEGFVYDNLIKIGFLNAGVDTDLDLYKENFDFIVLNDGEFDSINELVEGVVDNG